MRHASLGYIGNSLKKIKKIQIKCGQDVQRDHMDGNRFMTGHERRANKSTVVSSQGTVRPASTEHSPTAAGERAEGLVFSSGNGKWYRLSGKQLVSFLKT